MFNVTIIGISMQFLIDKLSFHVPETFKMAIFIASICVSLVLSAVDIRGDNCIWFLLYGKTGAHLVDST